MKRTGGKRATWIFIGGYAAFILISIVTKLDTGIRMGVNFLAFSREMIFIIPGAFVLIGLFEVWIPREIIERHLGSGSGIKGYFWSLLLAGTTVGGLYVTFPLAYSLYRKGARLGIIFAYVGLSGVCRIPMTLFEISFMGIEFTLIRYVVAVPMILFFSAQVGRYLEKKKFKISSPEETESADS